MQASDFVNLVWSMSRTTGTPYLGLDQDPGLFRDLIQECLFVYTSKTQCLEGLNVAFTPTIGLAYYDTFTIPDTMGATTIPATMTSAFCDVRQVTLNGSPLKVLDDSGGWDCTAFSPTGGTGVRYGESSHTVAQRNFPQYLTAANGLPVAFWQEAPNKLWFNCPFDQVYSSCYLSGRLYHDPLTGGDQQVLQLAPEDIRPAARYCVARLLEVNDFEKGTQMLMAAEAQMKTRRAEANAKSGGIPQRGTGNARQTVNMGR